MKLFTDPSKRSASADAMLVALTMLVALALGLVAVYFGTSTSESLWAGLLWAGACSSVGWFLGFLFGIPRSLSTDTSRTALPAQLDTGVKGDDNAGKHAVVVHGTSNERASRETRDGGRNAVLVNTNLEQISDWLTKIIVGVTLVNSDTVLARLESAAALIGKSLGGSNPDSFALALLVYFSTTGLLGSYLLTRLFLQRAFNNVG